MPQEEGYTMSRSPIYHRAYLIVSYSLYITELPNFLLHYRDAEKDWPLPFSGICKTHFYLKCGTLHVSFSYALCQDWKHGWKKSCQHFQNGNAGLLTLYTTTISCMNTAITSIQPDNVRLADKRNNTRKQLKSSWISSGRPFKQMLKYGGEKIQRRLQYWKESVNIEMKCWLKTNNQIPSVLSGLHFAHLYGSSVTYIAQDKASPVKKVCVLQVMKIIKYKNLIC